MDGIFTRKQLLRIAAACESTGRDELEAMIRQVLSADFEPDLFLLAPARGTDWIPVEERLPDRDGPVLIYAPSADADCPLIYVAWHDPSGPEWSGLPRPWLDAITHWLPLPKHPEKK
jgi:hypothetical protein